MRSFVMGYMSQESFLVSLRQECGDPPELGDLGSTVTLGPPAYKPFGGMRRQIRRAGLV